jgi:FKBP-type peptidyl-prolyl cis-trans isomerase FkpA
VIVPPTLYYTNAPHSGAFRSPTMSARWLSLSLLFFCGCFGPRSVRVDHATWETPSGVIVRDLFAGIGEGANMGDQIALEYTTWLDNGTEIDSTSNWGQAVIFELGKAPIPGWNEGLEGIGIGGRRRLILPPAMAYGVDGVPGTVPPNATLLFEVERVEMEASEPADKIAAEAKD